MEHIKFEKLTQIFVRLVFIIYATNIAAEGGIKDAFAYLRQHRSIINNAIAMCNTSEFYCSFYALNKVSVALNANAVEDSTMENAVWGYLSRIESLSYFLNNKKSDVLSDSISISFLLKLIDGCTGKNDVESGPARYAAQLLRDRASYASLMENRDRIRTAITNSCIDAGIRDAVLTLIGPNESEKQELLKRRMLSIPFLARIGDALAIKSLHHQYNNAVHYTNKVIAINHIFLSGQPELIRMVISDFNNPIYDVFVYRNAPPCTAISTQYAILNQVKRIYPNEKLLNEELTKLIYIRDRAISSEQTKRYIELVTKWLEETFDVTISAKPEAFIIKRMFGGCVNRW